MTAFSAIALKLGVSFNDYFTDNDLARVDYWLSKGAKPTDTLHAMIKRARRAAAPSTAPSTQCSSTATRL